MAGSTTQFKHGFIAKCTFFALLALFTAALLAIPSMKAHAASGTLKTTSYSTAMATATTQSTAYAAKSSYALLEKNGKISPCNSKGKKLASRWKSTSTVTKLFVAANVTKVPQKMGYTWYGSIMPFRPVSGNFKSVTFLTSKGKNACQSIQANTFEGYANLKSITNLEKTKLTTIGASAFARTGLTNVKLPKSVKTIGKGAFDRATKLKSVTGLKNTQIKTVSQEAFRYCTSLQSVALPKTCTSIGARAFYECVKLKTVSFGGKEKQIGNSAFEYCTALKSISLPASTKKLSSYAFYGCTKLNAVKMPCQAVVTGDTATSNMFGVFGYTPLAYGLGSIRVPSSLLSKYTLDSYSANPWYSYRSLFVTM